MKPTSIFIGVLAFLAVLALGIAGLCLAGYNRAVGIDEKVNQQWAQVERELQRRYDLLPNLEATVKGTALQEQKVFLGIAEARKRYDSAKTIDEKVAAAGQLEGALARLLVIVENYPELKSNESFLKLQDAIEGTENRVSVARKNYNDQVEVLNQFVRRFPSRIYAALADVQQRKYFQPEAGATSAPKIDFSDVGAKK